MARRSVSQFSANFEKSWLKAVWMTPSEAAAPQTLEIVERAAMHFGTRSSQRIGGRIGASESDDWMTGADEFLNDGRADKARRTSDEDTHVIPV